MHQGGDEVEAPAHAAGVGRDRFVERIGQIDELAQLLDALGHRLLRESVEQALQSQELTTGLLRVERRVLQRHADVQPNRARLRTDVEPGDGGLPTRRRDQRAEHPHGG